MPENTILVSITGDDISLEIDADLGGGKTFSISPELEEWDPDSYNRNLCQAFENYFSGLQLREQLKVLSCQSQQTTLSSGQVITAQILNAESRNEIEKVLDSVNSISDEEQEADEFLSNIDTILKTSLDELDAKMLNSSKKSRSI